LRVAECPDVGYFEPSGALDTHSMNSACRAARLPAFPREHGFFGFGTTEEINDEFAAIGKFRETNAFDLLSFIAEGAPELRVMGKDASRIINAMYRKAWYHFCAERGLIEYQFSASSGFHVGPATIKLGQRIPWGGQDDRRWSMLRNEAKGHVWQFGVTAIPAFWPFHHFKLKSRVIFGSSNEVDDGKLYDDKKKQHRLRRLTCSPICRRS
jgi:hypothetical protein